MVALTDVFVAEWDPAAAPQDTPSYSPLTNIIRVTTDRGRGGVGPTDVYPVGRASITVGNDNGEYPIATWYRQRPMHLATISGTDIFTGFVERFAHNQAAAPFTASAAVSCMEGTGLQARQEMTGTELVAEFGLLVAPNTVKLAYVPIEVDPEQSYNVFKWLQDSLALVECGAYFVDRAGAGVPRDRYWLLQKLAAGPEITISDTPAPGEFYALAAANGGTLEFAAPDETYYDRVVYSGLSGRPYVAQETPAGYFPETLQQTGLPCPSDRWMEANALYRLEVFKQTNTYPRRLTLHLYPAADPAIIEDVCALDIGSLITVVATPVGGVQQTYKCFVEQISHDIQAKPLRWDVTLGLSSADRWETAWGTYDDYLEWDTHDWDGTKKWAP